MENSLLGDDLELLNVKKKISKGLSVLLFRELILKVFSFAGQVILARILFPSDFGTIAIIAFIINFFSLFIDIGLSPAIIREKKKPSQKQLSTIFFTKLGLTLICIIAIFFCAPIFTKFINGFDTENIFMIWIYGLSLIFTTVKSVPVALIERDLRFDLVSKIDIVGVVAYQISVVLFAVFGFGIWSFIWGIYAKEIIECIAIYKVCPWRPSIYFNRKKINKMIRFGAYMQGGGIINFVQNSIIPVIGGLKTNPYQVGLLDWAFSNALIPETITNNFGRVAFPGFSKIRHNKTVLSDAISKSIKILLLLNVYFVVIVLGFGKEVVEIIYTSKWLPGVYVLYWFSASMIFMPIISVYAQGIFALGKSKTYFKFNLICSVIEWILAFYLVKKIGFEGIGISYFLFTFLLAFSSYLIARKEQISGNIFNSILPLIFIPISLIFANLLNDLISFSLIGLVLKILILSVIYLLLVSIIAMPELKLIFRELKNIIK
ncbi:MAG: hypothetical protein E6Q89_04850 [Bacteroidia bacterium]|nr:MAG: hypothetical protein E6Q89_04850 [Bacteroidia bacterium]